MPSIWPTFRHCPLQLFNHYAEAQLDHGQQLWSPATWTTSCWLALLGKDTCQEAMSRMLMVCDLLGMFHCNNLTIVQAQANQSSKQPKIMELLRMLFFTAAQHSFTVSLVYLPGWLNCIADALSCHLMQRFLSLAPQTHLSPTPLPPRLAEL